MTTPTVDQLRAALVQAGELVAGVTDQQWRAPTPCEEWDVRALVSHVISGNRLFTAALRDEPPAQPEVEKELLVAFTESATELLTEFSSAGALGRLVKVPFGTVPGVVALHLRLTEILVHGWDIAQATGQHPPFAESVVEQEIEFSHEALGAIPSDRRPFAPPQQAPVDAAAIDRLAALLGRDVTTAD